MTRRIIDGSEKYEIADDYNLNYAAYYSSVSSLVINRSAREKTELK